MIWAMGKNREIGLNNMLPWHIPEDLKHFRKTTEGKTVIMGLRTYESLGRPLPNRRNIVLHFEPIKVSGCEVYTSIPTVLEIVKNEDAFVIGGASIYRQFLPFAKRLYITFIDNSFKADAYFPEFDMNDWKLVSEENGNKEKSMPYEFYFRIYERLGKGQ